MTANKISITTEFSTAGKTKISLRGNTRPHKEFLLSNGYVWKQNPDSISVLAEKRVSPCWYKYLDTKVSQAAIDAETGKLSQISTDVVNIEDEYNKLFYAFDLKSAFSIKNNTENPEKIDRTKAAERENRQMTKTLLNAEILRVLGFEVGKKSLSELKLELPFSDNLTIIVENSAYYAIVRNNKNTIEVIIKNADHNTILSARITQYQTQWGRKVYAEHYTYDGWSDYDKTSNANVLRMFAYAALTLSYAYTHQEECPSLDFRMSHDISSGDDVLTVMPKFSNKSINEVLEKGEKSENNDGCFPASGSRKSPDEPFGVKGHYRHLSSGKVVWVRAYEKGNKQ